MPQDGLRQAPDLQIHLVPDGYVISHPQTGKIHHLNATAALLLELCDGRTTSDEVVARVQQAFSLKGAAVPQVRDALSGLIRAGLVSPAVVGPRAAAAGIERPRAPRAARRPAKARPAKPRRSKTGKPDSRPRRH